MICASCGTTNEAGRKFCKECGSALVVVCPACTSPNAPIASSAGSAGPRRPAEGHPSSLSPAITAQVTNAPATLV